MRYYVKLDDVGEVTAVYRVDGVVGEYVSWLTGEWVAASSVAMSAVFDTDVSEVAPAVALGHARRLIRSRRALLTP